MRLPNWKSKPSDLTQDDDARRAQEAAWPDMFANLQSAYAELTNAQFELERRASEIAETRDLVQQIVTSMSEALFLTDRAGRVIRANPAAANLLGCNEEAILGRPLTSVCGTEDIPATPWKLMEVAQGDKCARVDVDIEIAHGEIVPVSFALTLMHDKQDKITGVLAVARDMRQERALVTNLVAARTRFQELLEFAPDAIVLANQEGRVVLVNSQTERLFGHHRELLLGQSVEMLVPERYRDGKGSESLSVTQEMASAMHSPEASTQILPNLSSAGIVASPQSQVGEIPLASLDPHKTEAAVLTARNADEQAQQVEFSVVDAHGREFPVEITQRPIMTEDGLLLMSVIRDISERKQIEQELHISEGRYRALAETAQDVILTLDDRWNILFANPATLPVFGHAPETVVGRTAEWLMPRATLAYTMVRAETPDAKGLRVEVVEQRADQTSVRLEIITSQFEQDGVQLFTWFIRDITERHRIEQQLTETEALYRNIADTAAEVIVTVNAAGQIQFTNPATQRVFGYETAALIGQNLTTLLPNIVQPGENDTQVLKLDAREAVGRHQDGHEIQLEISFSEFDRDGARLYTGILHDVSERKQVEAALRLNQRALEASVAPIFIVNALQPELPLTYVNPAFERVTGYSAEEAIGRDCLFLQGEDREQPALNELREALSAGRAASVLLRNYRKDGALFYNELTVSPVLDEGGQLTHFVGFMHDVTERINADAALAQANAQQAASVARQSAVRLQLSHALSEPGDTLVQMLHRSCAALIEPLDAALVRVWLLNDISDVLKLHASAGISDALDGAQQHLSLKDSAIGQIVVTREAYLSNEVTESPFGADSQVFPAFVGAPLLSSGRALGVVGVYAKQPLEADALNTLSSVADAIAVGVERKRSEQERMRAQQREAARNNHHTALRFEVSSALNDAEATLKQILQRCADSIVEHLDASVVRLWLVNREGDSLSLQAKAGALAGALNTQQTVEMGQNEIGAIAQNRRPHLSNDVANDEGIFDRAWAHGEKLNSFAGYPLLASDDRLIGVLGMFARQSLEQETLHALSSVATTLVLGIERKRGEDERIALLEREQQARRDAEDASRLKDDFLAMVSHELRAPLTAILGWAQMLRSGTLEKASAEKALLTIERNAKSQAHLVGDLLDASRLATGKLRLDKRPLELMQLIEGAIDAVRPSVEAKQLRLQIVMEPWVGPFEGDPERMKQIVWNLLSNAVKFTPPKGLIEIRLEKLEDKALLIISDTGQGIEPEFLPYVFDRFRQADSSTKRQQGGLGLGLSIVKHLVEMHGGAIYAYSGGKGQGADFMITLPLGEPTVESEAQSAAAMFASGSLALNKPAGSLRDARILVVDDERDTREILSVMLSRYGAEVRMASSVAEGFEMFQSWRPDLLVSDIGMPVEDGYVMIGNVRGLSAEAGGATPCIALTAFASSHDRARAMEAGFNVHLSKPVEPVELARVVARTLGRSEEGIEL
jgi:PAS domain S-box-containing protein